VAVGLVYDPVYLKHDTGEHPENGGRLTAIMDCLEESGIQQQLTAIAARPATVDEIARVHTRHHINHIQEVASSGGAWLDSDTMVTPDSYEVAVCAAGGAIALAEAVMDSRVTSGFALVRPPGHHATPRQAMGFCLFNNIAIATAHALARYGLERALIIDFDVHHGNGTQAIFEERADVLYISTHEYPFYPGTGSLEETGRGAGAGNTVNIPLPAACGDKEYAQVYDQIIVPAARRYRPQLILVSAGYDPHWADEIGMMRVSVAGFREMAVTIKSLADELCASRLVFILEGGYNRDALSASVRATIEVLLGRPGTDNPLGPSPRASAASRIDALIKAIKELHSLN
jgi:acetoin utilization deacetylase AcuC-like enzyme